MVVRIDFAPADLAELRFAHSPMVEVVASSRALTRPAEFWMYDRWRVQAGAHLAAARLDTFFAVIDGPSGYVPDFLTPVLPTARPTLDDELRVVEQTPLPQVVAEIDAAWPGRNDAPAGIVRFGTDPRGALTVLLRQIRAYFTLAVAPLWPRLRAIAEAEIAYRARLATEHGPRALVTGLHPQLDWDGSALRMAYHNKNQHWGLDGHPLTLLPSGFAGPRVYYMTEAPTGRALWYPPRGYGRLLDRPGTAEPARSSSSSGPPGSSGTSAAGLLAVPAAGGTPAPTQALANLLGPTRAAVLSLLAAPQSTGEVASALGLAPATASHHLTTLRDAGLVAAERVGRRLRYQRTRLGEQLSVGG